MAASSTVRDRIVEACPEVAHIEDAIEDGLHAAKRAIKSRVRAFENFKDEGVHRVRRQPLQAVGAAFGIGVLLGVAVGWIGSRRRG